MAAFFYGVYSTVIHSSRPKGIICSDCGAKNQVEVEKIVCVVHFMFVPIIPIRVFHLFTCQSCKYEFVFKELEGESRDYFKQYTSKKFIPIWSFTLTILIGLMIGYFAYKKSANEGKMLERLTDGNQNQVIEFETDEGQFSTMKTLKITDDSVWVNYNDYEVKDYEFIQNIVEDGFYRLDTSIVKLDMLKKMNDEGKLKAVYSQ